MRNGGGKAKGAVFERLICQQLSLWLTSGKRKDVLWRSAMSGGRATVAKRKGQDVRQCGDICAVAPEGHAFCNHFYIECKHLKKIGLDGLIKGGGALLTIWEKTRQEAVHYDRVPLLIIRQNGWPTLLMTNSGGARSLQMSPKTIKVTGIIQDKARMTEKHMAWECLHIGLLSEVLEHCEPNQWVYRRRERIRPLF